MKKDERGKHTIRVLVILAAIGVLTALSLLLILNQTRSRLLQDRPLVMIHAPSPGQSFPEGEPVILHATARVSGNASLAQINLWIDDAHYAGRAVAEPDSSLLVLHETWIPTTSGPHSIVVTASTTGETEGRTSLTIEVLPAEGGPGVSAQAEELQTGESETTQSEDEPDSHPALAAAGEGGGEEDGVPLPDSTLPPGSVGDILTSIGFSSLQRLSTSDQAPNLLKLEIIELTTTRAFEGLHCYIGLAGSPPRWYPDQDADQTTDETFTSLGAGIWEVAPYFSGSRAPYLPWDSTEALEVEATCVGVTGGGLEAVEAGYLSVSIPMEHWDGIARTLTSEPLEGRFRITYRVTPLHGEPPGHRIGLDTDMPPPTDLRIVGFSLHWRYPDEEPIDGFRIFLNGELQWTEPAHARDSNLPYEWLHPPCGQTYEFTVDAIFEDDWSYPSNTVSVHGGDPGSEDCDRTLIVEFQEVETFDLSNDEDHGTWIGPLYGSFYVNDQEVRFNSRCRWGRYCDYIGFEDYSTYGVRLLTSHWGPGPARFTLNVGIDEDITVGFEIRDQDIAAWNKDDLVCSDSRTVRSETLGGESTISVGGDYDQGCRVTLTINPTLGSPATNPSGLPPRPQLAVTDLSVDEATGQLEIHITNAGYATWPGRDLDVIVRWRSGTLIGQYTFPALVLRPGESTILKHPDLVPSPHPPLGACVLLDPGNMVLEEEDYTPDVWRRQEYCRRLPDLTIRDVEIDEAEGRLLITIRNSDEGSIDDRSIDLMIELPDGRTILPERAWEGVSMEAYEARLFIWEDLNAAVRAALLGGFTVVVDPYNDIAESDGSNNRYTLPAGGAFEFNWQRVEVPMYDVFSPTGYEYNAFKLTVYVTLHAISDTSARELASWESTRTEIEFNHDPFGRDVAFDLEGDEALLLIATGEIWIDQPCIGPICESNLDVVAMTITPEEWASAGDCYGETPNPLRIDARLAPDNLHWSGGEIRLLFTLCRHSE
jgi:hypothetical protein